MKVALGLGPAAGDSRAHAFGETVGVEIPAGGGLKFGRLIIRK